MYPINFLVQWKIENRVGRQLPLKIENGDERNMNQDKLNSLFPEMVKHRRYLHQHPELSFTEEKTSQFIREQLELLGLEVQSVPDHHGLWTTIVGEQPGKTVALRADMDALEIQDQKTCDYASTIQGVMHACGHDGHTATLLAVAKYFVTQIATLQGSVRLIFQPAEEVYPGGAAKMIQAGVLEGVDVIYGVHLWTPIPIGIAESLPGALMASTDEFVITIHGKGGHGGMPHATVDSVVAGAALVMQLQTVVSRGVDPLEPSVVTIGYFNGGTAQNVIAESVKLGGTVRCFDDSVRGEISERIHRITNHVAAAYGAEAEIKYTSGYPSLINNAIEFDRFMSVAGDVPGLMGKHGKPIMPAEDFSYYLQHVPGCFVLVGAGNKDKGMVYPHHHPMFDFDEDAMLHAAGLMIRMTENYLA